MLQPKRSLQVVLSGNSQVLHYESLETKVAKELQEREEKIAALEHKLVLTMSPEEIVDRQDLFLASSIPVVDFAPHPSGARPLPTEVVRLMGHDWPVYSILTTTRLFVW